MKTETAAFELIAPDGHVYRIFVDGRTEGFPDGGVVINRIPLKMRAYAEKHALRQSQESSPLHPSTEAGTVAQLEHCVDALMREVRRLSDETKKLKKQKAEAHATLRSTASLFYARSKQLEGQ